jgi:hypothetical protein
MNGPSILKPFSRFIVYLQINGTFLPNLRLLPTGFRKQGKGMGSCTLRLLAAKSFTTSIASRISSPLPSQRFCIIDTYGLNEIPEEMYSLTEAKVIFVGRIRNISTEKYKDGNDYIGEISGDEDGWFFYNEAIYNCPDIPFNANVNGYYLGNKQLNGPSIIFEKYNPIKLKDSDVGETTWSDSDADFVFSLEDAITYVGSVSNVNFLFPWEADKKRIDENNNSIILKPGEVLEENPNYVSCESNKEKYKLFFDRKKPKSYTSLYGKSVVQWLDENLLDVFTYRFYYISSGFVNCQIINKSLVDTAHFPKAVLPITINANKRITNLSITDISDTYTQVEVVSNRILFSGTITTRNLGVGQKTMDRNWTYTDEKKYAYGNDTFTKGTPNPDVYRSSVKNQKAFKKFKFVKDPNSGCPIVVSKPFDTGNEYNERTAIPFFPFVSVNTNTGDLIISSSMSSHQTPDVSSLSWTNTLPFGYSDETSKYQLFEPFSTKIIGTTKDPYDKNFMHLHGSMEKPTIDIGDEISISMGIPQSLGYVKNDEKLFTTNGQESIPSTSNTSGGTYDWSEGSAETSPNPGTTSMGSYPYFSHWSMIYLTLAGHSAQRMSLYAIKDSPGIATKKKVIEVDDCEYWIAHEGTFKPTLKTVSTQGYYYVPEVTSETTKILRNDYSKQKSYLDMYSSFLFLDKKAVTIDFTVDGWTNNFEIGDPIYRIIDGQTVVTNSCIESIEYFLDSESPRIRIATLIPELPPLKKLSENIRIEGSAPQMSPMSTFKGPQKIIQKEEKKINVTKIQGQGGGGISSSVEPHKALQILYGQTAGGLDNVGYVATIPSELPLFNDVYASSFSPIGVGSAYLWTDGVRNDVPVLILNSNKIYPNMLISGQVVTTFASQQIKVTGSNPETFQTFYIPYGY